VRIYKTYGADAVQLSSQNPYRLARDIQKPCLTSMQFFSIGYHLVSAAPVPVAALRTLALGYQHMHAPRFVPPEIFERTRLTRAEQTLDRQVCRSNGPWEAVRWPAGG
jgi:hypothetical protein